MPEKEKVCILTFWVPRNQLSFLTLKKTIPQYQFVLDQKSDISKLDLGMTQTQCNYRLVKGILLYRSRTGSVICCLISTFRNNYRANLHFIDMLFSLYINVKVSAW